MIIDPALPRIAEQLFAEMNSVTFTVAIFYDRLCVSPALGIIGNIRRDLICNG